MIRRRFSMLKCASMAISAFCVALATAPVAHAASPFSLSGNAQQVTGGTGPNNAALDLTSACTTSAAPCGFNPTTSDVSYTPSGSLTVADISNLSTDYNIGGSDCGGGSPRFSIETASGNIFVYFGPYPNFTGCFYGWQNTGNVTTSSDLRVDTSQVGGTFYDTWAHAVQIAGTNAVKSVSVVLDGGWIAARGQDVTIDNFTVNNAVMNGNNVH